jgi:hypothetical protein
VDLVDGAGDDLRILGVELRQLVVPAVIYAN